MTKCKLNFGVVQKPKVGLYIIGISTPFHLRCMCQSIYRLEMNEIMTHLKGLLRPSHHIGGHP